MNGIDGDLNITISLKENANFIRDGNDIIQKKFVTLGQAIDGCSIDV